MPLGKRLKECREKLGKSQLTVASDLELNNIQLSRYEAGIHKPDTEALRKLADYYGTTTDYLLGRTDISVPDTKINPEEQAQFEAFVNNPEHGSFIKEYLEASEERKQELKLFWRILREAEVGRKFLNAENSDNT